MPKLGILFFAVTFVGCGTSQRVARFEESDPFLAAATTPAVVTASSRSAADPFQSKSPSPVLHSPPATVRVSDHSTRATTYAWAQSPAPASVSPVADAPARFPVVPEPTSQSGTAAPSSGAIVQAAFVSEVTAPSETTPANDWHPTRQEQTAAKPFPVVEE